MRLAALRIKSKILSAEARLVLFRLLARFGHEGSQPLHLKVLLEELRVPYALGSRAITELVDARMLLKHSAPLRKRGRPLSSYVPAANILARLDEDLGDSCAQRHRIDLVLSFDIRNRLKPTERSGGVPHVRGIGETLSGKDLWLLGVLLDHADALGVTSNLSRATLTMLTGIKAKSLVRRLEKLVELRLLYSAVPWARSKQLSCTLNLLVHLNLNAPIFGQQKRPVKSVHFPFLSSGFTEGNTAPATESLPLAPFSLTKIATLERIFRLDQTKDVDADGGVDPAECHGEPSDWPDEESEEEVEAREQLEIDLRETKRQQAELQGSLPGILNTIRIRQANRGWTDSLEVYFQDFANRRVLEWFRSRIMLYAASILGAKWKGTAEEADEPDVLPDSSTLELVRRDFSHPLASAEELGLLHHYIAGLAAAYADHLDFWIRALPKESELEETVAKGDCSVTITRQAWGTHPTRRSGCVIFIWLTKESPSKNPVVATLGETPGLDLPTLKWLQSPLPTRVASSASSDDSANKE
ncbi:MAG: hypothetical protein JJT88_19585 [Gammaproteobacteria bacterium]|nr:hypothetical protein [Gammaproteobacteria bacterium]